MMNVDMRVNGVMKESVIREEISAIYRALMPIDDRFPFVASILLCHKKNLVEYGVDSMSMLYCAIDKASSESKNGSDGRLGFQYAAEFLNNKAVIDINSHASALANVFSSFWKFLDELKPNKSEYLQIFDIAYSIEVESIHNGECDIPNDVVTLASQLIQGEVHSVYDPFAKTMKFVDAFPNTVFFVGNEINQRLWRLGHIRLAIAERYATIDMSHFEPLSGQRYDAIVSLPPFTSSVQTRNGEKGAVETLMLSHFEDNTTANGQMFLICTPSLLYSTQFKNLRKDLILKNYIDTIVLLPSRLLTHTGISTVALYLNKNKANNTTIRIIDSRNMVVKGVRSQRLDLDNILSAISDSENPNSLIIDSDSLDEYYTLDYDVIKSERDRQDNAVYPRVLLRDIIGVTPKSHLREGEMKKTVQIKDLSFDPFSAVCSPCEAIIERPQDYYVISEPSILVAAVGSMRTGFVDAAEDNLICIHRNVIALSVVNNYNIDLDYLRYEISKLTYLFTGAAYQRLYINSLLNAKIEVPGDINVQKSIYTEAKRTFLQEKAVANGLAELLDEKKNEYMNEVRMRKHDMRPYIRNMRSNYNMMVQFVKEHSSMPDFEEKMQERLARLLDNINNLSTMLENLSSDESFGTPENIDIKDFLNGIVARYGSDDRFSISLKIDDASFERDGIDEEKYMESFFNVSIARIDLERMVENIVSNAIKHGFTEVGKKYNLSIVLGFDSDTKMFYIDFVNDGTPMPKGMDRVAYGLLGEKAGANAGSGQGGHIVKRITEHYKGDYDVMCDGCVTTIKILLPMYQFA